MYPIIWLKYSLFELSMYEFLEFQ